MAGRLAVAEVEMPPAKPTPASTEKPTLAPAAKLAVGAPHKKWGLEIGGRFIVERSEISPSFGERALLAVNDKKNVNLSIFMEQAPKEGDSKACREFYLSRLKNSPIKFESETTREMGEMAISERLIRDAARKMTMKDVNAYISHDGVWIDVHVSKVLGPGDEGKELDNLIGTVKILDKYQTGMLDYRDMGLALFRRNNGQRVPEFLSKALELEKKSPMLGKDSWRVTVDCLAMAYGMSGQMDKCRATLEDGIKADPTYPNFHYNLACMYAESNDLDHAIDSLRTAFKYKENRIKGEKMPDPRNDSSFAKYMSDEKFKAVLKEIGS
ncbi:hypothetical protein LLG95_10575 [bacterium]|nr:hypothetical protein [bacterium]